MTSQPGQIQTLYEMALAINDGNTHEAIAANAIYLYLQHLHGKAGAILRCHQSPNRCWYQLVEVKWPGAQHETFFNNALSSLPLSPEKCELGKHKQLPQCIEDGERRIYFFDLPDFGVLIFFKTGQALSADFIALLARLNATLSGLLQKHPYGETVRQQRSATLLNSLVHSIPDLIWLKDADGVYLACNPQFENFFGASEAQIVGKTDYDFVSTVQADFFRQHDKMAMQAGQSTTNEEEVRFVSDGHKALLETIKTPIKDADGEVIGVLGIARDITGRKRSEMALKESKERFEEMANLLPQPIWEVDKNGKFTYTNKAGFEIFGYQPQELNRGINFIELIAPEDRQRIKEKFELLKEGIENEDFEYKCLKKNGESFPVLIYSAPIKLNGDFFGLRGLALDISPLKDAQKNLSYFSALQDVLISISTQYINVPTEMMPDAISAALQEIGEFVFADRAYIFDYDFDKGFTNNTYEWCRAGIEPQIDNLQEVPLEMIPQWTDNHIKGKPIYVPDVMALPEGDGVREVLEPQQVQSLIAIPMMHEKKCMGFIGFDSVMEKHQYSEKEKKILEVFAQVVVNLQLRTSAMRELKEAKEKAEIAEKAQFNFLSTMSHEIRTPLNAVVGLSNILLMEKPEPRQLKNLNALKFSAQNLLNIINNILDFNKMVSGNITLEQIDFSIRELIQSLHFSLNGVAQDKNISLGYTIDEKIPEVIVGDSTRFMQIINNLVSNALKFTKKGGVDIIISEIKNNGKITRLRVSIKDTGIGIPIDKREDIFEEFKQSSSAINREYGGTGLGLPIVKKLLAAMDTEIVVESIEGGGSEFWFEIDFLIGDSKNKKTDKAEKVVFDDSLKGLKILLVEDNKINQMVTRKFLDEWQCNTRIAENGQEAIDMLIKNPYDLILMDLQMPVMDGYTATRHIRLLKDESQSRIPIIALSASALGEIETRARNFGMNDFVTKPFEPAVLFSAIRKQSQR